MTIREIKSLWDSFEVKDMSWPEFLAEFRDLTDPASMQRDMAQVMSQKQLERSTRSKINAAVAGRN